MALNGHAPDSQLFDGQDQTSSHSKWHEKYGSEEFKVWQSEHPTQNLSYEDWKSSKHVDGLSLYYAALHIWEESDSSEADVEQPQIETRPRGGRAQSAREPKKTLKANGHGPPRSVGTSTPSAVAHSEDPSVSSKKKRKARKKYLSEELVASEESEDAEAATPNAEALTPSAPAIAVNGRRKSSNRRPRKKPISEETISPEDEEDDPMGMSGVTTPAIASPLPVRSAPKAPTTKQNSGPPRKTILKLHARKAPRKKVLSEEMVQDDDTDEGNAAAASSISEPSITATTESQSASILNNYTKSNDVAVSPSATSETAAATRRGLRTRRPAQQRPYSLDAQIYEDHDTDVQEEESFIQPSPSVLSRRASIVSLGKDHTVEQFETLDEESLAILQGEVDPEPEDNYNRPKHFKGKGRAWKKEESDEDLEFNPGKKKAAKIKSKAKIQQPPKKRGRPRKSHLSEDVVRDDSDDETATRMGDTASSPAVAGDSAKKSRTSLQKSALSEEIVHDDTDEDVVKEEGDQAPTDVAMSEVSTPAPKKRGRPRKSDQTSASKPLPVSPVSPAVADPQNQAMEDTVLNTREELPDKSTEKTDENVEPEQIELPEQTPAHIEESVEKTADLGSDSKPIASSPPVIEATEPEPSVNAQTVEGSI